MPDLAYDNIADGSEAMRVSPISILASTVRQTRYDWKLVGKKETRALQQLQRLTTKELKYSDILDKNTVKSDLMRYELHRVWIVEATSRPGQKHIYGSASSTRTKTAGCCSEDAYVTTRAITLASRPVWLCRITMTPSALAWRGNLARSEQWQLSRLAPG